MNKLFIIITKYGVIMFTPIVVGNECMYNRHTGHSVCNDGNSKLRFTSMRRSDLTEVNVVLTMSAVMGHEIIELDSLCFEEGSLDLVLN